MVKESTLNLLAIRETRVCNTGDKGSISGLGRSPGGGHANPLQYSCLENPVDKGAWQATQSIGSQRVGHY